MRTALITGASRGIGAAIADALAPTHSLLLAGRSSPALQSTAERLGATPLPLDVTDIDTIQDSAALRMSAGVGILWKSPFGPIAIDIAYPILKESFDKTQFLNFSVGTSF